MKEELIPALNKVCNWLRFNKLSLNTVKTEFMSINTHQDLERIDHDPAATPYMISAGTYCEIKRESEDCQESWSYIDDTLTWSHHVEYISTKIRRGIGILKKNRKISQRRFSLDDV